MNYKIGDTVYFYIQNQVLKGVIESIDYDHLPEYPIIVRKANGVAYGFTEDGYLFSGEKTPSYRLSFTPFEVKVIGATYERPEVEIPVNTLVWVRKSYNDLWEARFYSHKEGGMHYCFANQLKSNQDPDVYPWQELSIECPLN